MEMQTARIAMGRTTARVVKDTKEMEQAARTSMSVKRTQPVAMPMQPALTTRAHFNALAFPGTQAMASTVQMWMNARLGAMVVMEMLRAQTLTELSLVHVIGDS